MNEKLNAFRYGDVGTVWAVFWITFQLGWLVGFVLIGIASFKLTQDQMAVEAGMFARDSRNLPDEH